MCTSPVELHYKGHRVVVRAIGPNAVGAYVGTCSIACVQHPEAAWKQETATYSTRSLALGAAIAAARHAILDHIRRRWLAAGHSLLFSATAP